MGTHYDEQCPLCHSAATFCKVRWPEAKYFECPKCKYFQITRPAEKALLKKSQSYRDMCSEQAQHAPENQLLLIRMKDRHLLPVGEDPVEHALHAKSDLTTSCE